MTKKKIIQILSQGGIGVLPTDTLYGLVGSAFSEKAVARIYAVRKRNGKKPFIILIGSFADLGLFNIKLETKVSGVLKKIWPGKVSVILPCPQKKFSYLHRGTKTMAFRLPADKKIAGLLKKTGPLAAPSANPEGLNPAQNILQAKKYFGDKADFYWNGGILKSKPSTIIAIEKGKIIIRREGTVKINL